MEIEIKIFVILLMIVCLILLEREWMRYEKKVRDMEKRIEDLESASRQRLPYRSQEELLDAMAAISRYVEERKIQDAFIENAAGHITTR